VDWQRWHDDYADASSDLSHRLRVVQGRIREWADASPPGRLRLLSACAGQAHDVVGALRDHPRRADVEGVLVELDPTNVVAARAAVDAAGLGGLQVRCADAGTTTAYAGGVPAGLVLMCGVFGNVDDADIERTIAALPMLCAPGAHVVWTRHRFAPDRTPAIRRWFAGSGFTELDFTSPQDTEGSDGRSGGRFSVGTHRLSGPTAPYVEGVPLFQFTRV
jgi:hypothetical protein